MSGWFSCATATAGAASACFHDRPVTIDAEAVSLRTRATYASVAVSAVLIVIKFAAWLATGSVAMLSSLVDSLLDVVASIVNVFAVRQAVEPADREHRFGHGKAEPLAALGQSAFLAGGALLLTFEAISRIVNPAAVSHATIGIAVMLVSILFDGALVLYQRYVVSKTASLAIGADELHFRSDLIVNAGVLGALLLDYLVDLPVLDAVIGGAIGLWIIYGSARLLRLSLTQLMDHELPDEDRARIRAIVEAGPEVAAVHDLRTRAAGPTAFIQLHLEMDGAMSLLHAHQISDVVEARLRGAYPNAEIIIHQDPAGLEEPRQTFPASAKAS
jgi:ferrous-iron efflux pump FieF